MKNDKLFKLTSTAILAGLASAIYYFLPEIPIIPGIEHLKIDLSDIPAVAAALVAGPVPAIMVELIKNLLHLTKSTTFGVGDLCNFLVGISFAIPFGVIFKRNIKNNMSLRKSFLISSVIGLFTIVVAGVLVNLAFVPLYFVVLKMPFVSSVYYSFVIGAIPLNISKGIINIILAFPIIIALKKTRYFSD